RRQHAVDGGADQFGLVGGLDIFVADAVEHQPEQFELAIEFVLLLPRLPVLGRDGADRHEDRDQSDQSPLENRCHQLVPLSCCRDRAVRRPSGSMGVPPSLSSIYRAGPVPPASGAPIVPTGLPMVTKAPRSTETLSSPASTTR